MQHTVFLFSVYVTSLKHLLSCHIFFCGICTDLFFCICTHTAFFFSAYVTSLENLFSYHIRFLCICTHTTFIFTTSLEHFLSDDFFFGYIHTQGLIFCMCTLTAFCFLVYATSLENLVLSRDYLLYVYEILYIKCRCANMCIRRIYIYT